MAKTLITHPLSDKVLMVGEYFRNNAPGGMAAVLASYDLYFEDMKFIANWKAGPILLKAWYALKSIFIYVFTLLCDKQIKIVHIQGAAFASFDRNEIFVKIAHWFNKKIVYHIHCADFASYYDPLSEKRKTQVVAIINSCDKFVVLSTWWKEYFVGLGIDESRIEILNNIVSPARPMDIPDKNGKIVFLYLGIIGQRKGVYDLVDVIAAHKEQFDGKIKLIIGGNQEEEKLCNHIKKYGLEEMVDFRGFIAGDDKIRCLNYADVYVLPSYNEGLPIAILEAMTYSHPIISTNVGGIPEILHDGENGVMITPGDKVALADALAIYVNSPELIRSHGENSLKLVQNYLPQEVFYKLENIYNDLL